MTYDRFNYITFVMSKSTRGDTQGSHHVGTTPHPIIMTPSSCRQL